MFCFQDILDFGKCYLFPNAVISSFFSVHQTMLFVCFVAAEFLALCPNGVGITGDGRGNECQLIVCVLWILKELRETKPLKDL